MTPIASGGSGKSHSAQTAANIRWGSSKVCCYDLCPDASIQDAIEVLCQNISELNDLISKEGLDLACLLRQGDDVETISWVEIINRLAEKSCEECSCPGETGNPQIEIYPVPLRLRDDDENGDPVVSMEEDDYIKHLGFKLADGLTEQDDLVEQVSDISQRVANIEQAPDSEYTPPKVVVPGINGSSNTPIEMDAAIEMTSVQFAELRVATGMPEDIVAGNSKMPQNINSEDALSVNGTVSSLPSWEATPTNQAEVFGNSLLLIDDVRKAVAAIQQKVRVNCKDIVLDINAGVSKNGQTLTVYFNGYTHIPTELNDAGSTIKIEDFMGNSYSASIDLVSLSTSQTPLTVNIAGSTLEVGSDYDITITSNISGNNLTCQKILFRTVVNTMAVCPQVVLTSDASSITAVITPKVDAGHIIDIIDGSTNAVVATKIVYGSSAPFTETFSGLTASKAYKVKISVDIPGKGIRTCPVSNISTTAQ